MKKFKFFRGSKEEIWEIAAVVLLIAGLVLAFFYIHLGGALVGLACGLSFYKAIQNTFFLLQDYTSVMLFKTLILLGVALYLLITVPYFLIGTLIGFIINSLCHLPRKRR